MELFLSKEELEILNDEYKDTLSLYNSKENVITQIFAIKIYNLIKENPDAADKYIDRIFKISSICKDINLVDYNIKDIKVFLTIEEGILSGFTLTKKSENNSVFSTIIKIANDFILTIPKDTIRHPIIESLLKQSNIKCLTSFSNNIEEKLINRFLENFNDRFAYNMYVEYQFRKDKFLQSPLTGDEKVELIKFYTNFKETVSENSVEKYIGKMFKDYLIGYGKCCIQDIIVKLKNTMSKDIENIEYLYQKALANIDKIIIENLNTTICDSSFRNNPLIILDLLFIKDEIFQFVNKKNKENQFKKSFENKISKLNNIYSSIYNEISTICNIETYTSLSVTYGQSLNIVYKKCKLLKKPITIENTTYQYNFIRFINNDTVISLDNLIEIDNILNLKIFYKNNLLYSIPEETKNLLVKINKQIVAAIKNSGYVFY